jgi:hypothetical protein
MSKATNYQPGHSVHFIQARKALEASVRWQPATVVEVGEGTIRLQLREGVAIYICNDTQRLSDLFDTGRVPLNAQGDHFAIFAPHGVLIVPCGDEGKVFPTTAGINSTVAYIEEGAVLWSPTTDGAWHLFSIASKEQPTNS